MKNLKIPSICKPNAIPSHPNGYSGSPSIKIGKNSHITLGAICDSMMIYI